MKQVLYTIILLSLALLTREVMGRGSCNSAWVSFVEETNSRIVAAASLGISDTEEKDYAWGDLDNDGDIDLVCVRKQPFTSPGRRANVLFMNEGIAEGHAINGVLVDRTALYASDADDGGQGFLDLTNDRDVVIVDVNGDGWLDVVTATTISDGLPKTISHPRVYINKGEIGGVWQGLRYEQARIPQFYTFGANEPKAPRFCSVAAGDLTGDGRPELYFGDYDSSGAGGSGEPAANDIDNRLLLNDGNGFFTDASLARMGSNFNYPGIGNRNYLFSAFGAASVIADMNNDGVNDVIKQTSLNPPTHVAVVYNNMNNEGFFNRYVIYNNLSPYFVSVGDLNSDGWLDMVITDDGTDRYSLNQGNGGVLGNNVTFTDFLLPNSGGFGSQSIIIDLDGDGHNDILISDVDVDIGGCDRRLLIYRNQGNVPNVTFQDVTDAIPTSQLTGTFHTAVFDLNGDGLLDIILGRCSGTNIWIQQPQAGLNAAYPNGQPGFIPPDSAFQFRVDLNWSGGGSIVPGSGRIYVSVNGAPFTSSLMTHLKGHKYTATLPATSCPEDIRYYFSADLSGGGTQFHPCNAPANSFVVAVASGLDLALRDEIEGDVSGWTVINQSLTAGAWEAADPIGTPSLVGLLGLAAPDDDATAGAANVKAFITQNGLPGGSAGAADVDGGPTHLISPPIDLSGTDAIISFARWFHTENGTPDQLVTSVSNDGNNWVTVTPLTTGNTFNTWETVSFIVSDYVTPTANVRVRFTTSDNPNNSVTEAGIDNFQVEVWDCTVLPVAGACCFGNGSCSSLLEAACSDAGGTFQGEGAECSPSPCSASCPMDIVPPGGDGHVSIADINAVLAAFGSTCNGCPEDVVPPGGDGQVSIADINAVLSAFGPCPQ